MKEKLDDLITKKFQGLYKNKKGANKKVIERDEQMVSRNYSTETSPYREWLDKKGLSSNDFGITEPIEANPDSLADSKTLWPLSIVTDEQKEMVSEILDSLTPKQRRIIELIGLEGKTYDHAAVILGVSKRTIQTTIDRIRHKFKRK